MRIGSIGGRLAGDLMHQYLFDLIALWKEKECRIRFAKGHPGKFSCCLDGSPFGGAGKLTHAAKRKAEIAPFRAYSGDPLLRNIFAIRCDGGDTATLSLKALDFLHSEVFILF